MGHETRLVQGRLPVRQHEVAVLHMPVDCFAGASACGTSPLPTSPFVASLPSLIPCQQRLSNCNALLHSHRLVMGIQESSWG